MHMDKQVIVKINKYGIEVHLDSRVPFEELLLSVEKKFQDASNFFKGTAMAVSFLGRVLSEEEEDRLMEVISDNADIDIVCVIDYNEEKEAAYRSVVEQSLEETDKREGQFYRGTLGKRQVLESDTNIIILGNVELGAKVIAKGNVIIVGSLYGSVHAGAAGDETAFVVALSMQPKQLRIGDIVAKRQIIFQENVAISGPKIAVVDGHRIYIDPLVD